MRNLRRNAYAAMRSLPLVPVAWMVARPGGASGRQRMRDVPRHSRQRKDQKYGARMQVVDAVQRKTGGLC